MAALSPVAGLTLVEEEQRRTRESFPPATRKRYPDSTARLHAYSTPRTRGDSLAFTLPHLPSLPIQWLETAHLCLLLLFHASSLSARSLAMLLRPEHRLRSPPATAPAPSRASISVSAPARPAVSRLPRGALRLPRAASPLRGKASSAVRASAGPAGMPSVAHREVARAVAGEAEARLGDRLLPSAVPADVAEFRNGDGTALGSLDVRRGAPGSSIDFMLQSSLHCKVPNGAIDITSLFINLNASTDAPHFVMEFIQGSPTSMVVLLDLLPRKDLALHPEYIEKYYGNTEADKQRKIIEELPQARPYLSPSLFVRSAFSPTAVFFTIDCGQGGESVLEEIVHGHLASVVKGLLQIWLGTCAGDTSEVDEGEREIMVKRDRTVRSKSIEVDLTANLPRMFGPDVSGRVIAEIRKAFGVEEA
ncbi:red chlorophyll catabolite reductase 1, chloroplastic [Aegilops tauschii subsp. strangulata]|nr:red chlorophyll catabolite reductase 1, chloroplastic-like [Triticum aestivum]